MNHPYQAIRVTSNWRARLRFARDRVRQRMLDCFLPTLWVLTLMAAAALTLW